MFGHLDAAEKNERKRNSIRKSLVRALADEFAVRICFRALLTRRT